MAKLKLTKENVTNLVKQIYSQAEEATIKEMGEKYENICITAIQSFYDDYTPKKYHRDYSLNESYSFVFNKNHLDVRLSGENIKKEYERALKKGGADYIVGLTLGGGWHGGAISINPNKVDRWGEHPDSGIPYWRQPYLWWDEWADYPAERQKNSAMKQIGEKISKIDPSEIFSKCVRDAVKSNNTTFVR